MKRIIESSGEDYLDEETIYSDDFREELLECGEIDAWEDAFMHGYDEAG